MLPAMPSALAASAVARPPRCAAAAVAPKIPQIAVGWKPRSWKAPGVAMPTRVTISLPATIAVEQLAAARAARLRDRERGRHDDRGDVRHRVGVRVVEVEAVAEHRVGEGGVRRRQPGVEPDHRRLRLAAELRHRRAALGADAEPVRGEPAAEDVEHVQLRGLDDGRRHVVEVELERPGGEPLRGGHTVHSSSVPGKLRSACGAVRL